MFKRIKAEGGVNDTTYRKIDPKGACAPKFYGLPKIPKRGIPLRHIISPVRVQQHRMW